MTKNELTLRIDRVLLQRDAIEAFVTRQAVTEKWYPPPIIYLATVKAILGENAKARELLDELSTRVTGGWKSRVDTILQELEALS